MRHFVNYGYACASTSFLSSTSGDFAFCVCRAILHHTSHYAYLVLTTIFVHMPLVAPLETNSCHGLANLAAIYRRSPLLYQVCIGGEY